MQKNNIYQGIGSRVNGNVRSRTRLCHPDISGIHSLTNHICIEADDPLPATTYPISIVSVKSYELC